MSIEIEPAHPRTSGVRDWWPDRLDVDVLHRRHPAANPLGSEFDYGAAFDSLDLATVKRDIAVLLTSSQAWWPADWGHYGPLMIRMAWHSAGTYRISDGRGGAGDGQQRFAPLNSWPDNANLDKARRLLWPIKQKYGRSLSWADLMILAGNVALESMGFPTYGFAGGRADVWEPDDMYWGAEREWLADERYSGERELADPLAAVQMGLIYVNPEGPGGNPDPLLAARDIRETFRRMAMNDEETVALIAGGHSFGKSHGASAATHVGREPEAGPLHHLGLGWRNAFGAGHGADTITSGLEGAWKPTPTKWDNGFLETLFGFEWQLSTSPAGAKQWIPTDPAAATLVPDAHDSTKRHSPVMLTTDLALRFDPEYRRIAERFLHNPEELTAAFAHAWFKLTHRDMGPRARYRGVEVPAEALIWQDPLPAVNHPLIDNDAAAQLKAQIMQSGLSVRELVLTAWASASTFRGTDKRGGANGARLRLQPQREWPINNPAQLERVLGVLDGIREGFQAARTDGTRLSMADLIVLAGCAAVEKAAADGGHAVTVPFTPGRTDATQEQTDVEAFAVLEPRNDGFRNYAQDGGRSEAQLIERAVLLQLSAPQLAVLVAGMRVLGANADGSDRGVFTQRPGVLSNDFFVHLLAVGIEWEPTDAQEIYYEGCEQGEHRWNASRVDLLFGAHSQLRALAEVYAADDAGQTFVQDFISAWTKVMELDRFDLHP